MNRTNSFQNQQNWLHVPLHPISIYIAHIHYCCPPDWAVLSYVMHVEQAKCLCVFSLYIMHVLECWGTTTRSDYIRHTGGYSKRLGALGSREFINRTDSYAMLVACLCLSLPFHKSAWIGKRMHQKSDLKANKHMWNWSEPPVFVWGGGL